MPTDPGASELHADPERRAALRERLSSVGRELSEREAARSASLEEAWRNAEALQALVADALAAYHQQVDAAGARQLRVELSAPRTDEKHLHSVQFDVSRGRHRGIVTVKSRGEVTLVGPFRAGKNEGPCKSFPVDAVEEIEKSLGDFLERFLREAATP